jgi:fimbrial chaperone protein
MLNFSPFFRAVPWLMATATLALPAAAGQFSVSPVRIYMASRDRATAVTLNNEGNTELLMQADIYEWKQKPDGQDELTLSEDMILSPPIVKMAPRSRQVVRLALLRPVLPGMQQTFRLIVREVPEAKPADKSVHLQIAMAFSLPVFISPPGVKRQLDCTAERSAPNSVRAVCGNTGTAYAQPVDFLLTGAEGVKLASRDAGGYILPGIQRSFDMQRADGLIPAGKVRLAIKQDDGATQTFDITLSD